MAFSSNKASITHHRPNTQRGNPAISRTLEFPGLVVEHTEPDLHVCIDDAGRDLVTRERQIRLGKPLVGLPWVWDIVRLGIKSVNVDIRRWDGPGVRRMKEREVSVQR